MITGLITKGQGDRKRFVTSYTMSYSNDSVAWYAYKDGRDAKVFRALNISNRLSYLTM